MNESYQQEIKNSKGISIKNLNFIMILIAVILAASTIILSYTTDRSYRQLSANTDVIVKSREDASKMMEASDYLTEMVRQFVITGNDKYLENYFEEVKQTRRRETALDDLESFFGETEAYGYLEEALERSNQLTETEYYAMRLVVESSGQDPGEYPGEVSGVQLSSEDQTLSKEKKKERAIDLVFGTDYEQKKNDIRSDVMGCLDRLMLELQREQEESSGKFMILLHLQTVLIAVLLGTFFLVVWLTFKLVISPLEIGAGHIEKNELIPERGSAEMRFMARKFNALNEQSRQHQERLSYEATHDDLTDLLNRGVFEDMRAACDPDSIAMIIVDVDKFKEINDTYGHDTGDKILKKVAANLKRSFRSEDYVCRIGGDEFAVIMVNAGSALKELVQGKMKRLNDTMAAGGDGLPEVTLSIGVAFGDREDPTDDIFKDADTALYRVKEAGRANCGFY